MKFLFLLSMLIPAMALATSPYTPAEDADADARGRWSKSFYRGKAVYKTADGTETQAVVALETMRWRASTDWHSGMLFVYHVHMKDKSSVHAFIIKRQRNGFFKVFVPVDDSVTATVESALQADKTKFRESGWGYKHSYRGRHGYKKVSFFLNYVYTTGDRIDHNIMIKKYDDGSRKLYSHVLGGTDADGMRFVWRDKMTMVPSRRH